MTILRNLALLLACAALMVLAGACDSGPPATPTPIPIQPGPTVPPEEAGLLPVRVVGRGTGMQDHMFDPQGTPFRIATPVANTTFKLEFTNRTGKDLKSWRGVLAFKDVNGTTIESFSTRFELPEKDGESVPLKEGESAVIDYSMVYTEHIPARKTLREQSVSELVVTFRPVSLTYSDGNVETLETPLP